MLRMMRLFSTFTQFSAAGTNQLELAARANGATCLFVLWTLASDVVFGSTLPTVAMWRIRGVPVNSLIQSSASERFLLVTGIARSEPPRNVGMYLPGVWLGIG